MFEEKELDKPQSVRHHPKTPVASKTERVFDFGDINRISFDLPAGIRIPKPSRPS